MNKTLTISVAAYNMGEYLKDALDSLLDATILPDIEVIVVDDGSTDDTADIAHQYESTFPETFRVISQQNGGYGSTINASLQQAHGKYFKQLDGDDFFITDNLQAYIGVLKHSTADIVYTVGEYRYENTAPPKLMTATYQLAKHPMTQQPVARLSICNYTARHSVQHCCRKDIASSRFIACIPMYSSVCLVFTMQKPFSLQTYMYIVRGLDEKDKPFPSPDIRTMLMIMYR